MFCTKVNNLQTHPGSVLQKQAVQWHFREREVWEKYSCHEQRNNKQYFNQGYIAKLILLINSKFNDVYEIDRCQFCKCLLPGVPPAWIYFLR